MALSLTKAVFCFVLICSCVTAIKEPLRWLSDACTIETTKGTIDLTPLANNDNSPRFRDKPSEKDQFLYSWNPCLPFNEGTCNGVAVCQRDTGSSKYFTLGFPDKISFQDKNGYEGQIVYHTFGDIERLTTISLICDTGVEGDLEVIGESQPMSGDYNFILRSRYACPTSPTPPTPPTPGSATAVSPTESPSPSPDVFSLGTITILLFSIQGSLVILIVMLFIGLLTRRSSSSSYNVSKGKDAEKSQFAYQTFK